MNLWQVLQQKAEPVEEWVVEAEAVLQSPDDENIPDTIARHKVNFIQKNSSLSILISSVFHNDILDIYHSF